MDRHRRVSRVLAATSLSVAALATSCDVDYGELPARCSTGECPEGYDCINGVCALPGTSVPITVVELGNQRGGDLKLIPLSDGVLVAWESYPYAPLGQAILAKRLRADGSLSETIVLEDTWSADPGAVEPFFDLHALDDDDVLVAIASSPVDPNDERPRLRVFRANLAGGSEAVWGGEVHMGSIGYGNVSQPRFRAREDGALELAYFEARVLGGETVGRLAVFELGTTGELQGALDDCGLDEETCCPAHRCMQSARTGSVASTMAGALDSADGTTWVIDEARPSCMRIGADPMGLDDDETSLPTLAVPVRVEGEEILFIQPSERVGEKLPDDLVAGAAKLFRQPFEKGGTPELVGDLPVVRDNPRLAWVEGDGDTGLLVTPGADISSPTLEIHSVDEMTAETSSFAQIERLSSLSLGGLRAVRVGDDLFVAWLDVADDRAVIRAAVLSL